MPQADPVVNFQLCTALYDNIADSPDELSFKADDILIVIEQDTHGHDGWWVCMHKGRQGICPKNRLRLLSDAEQSLHRDLKVKSWHRAQKAGEQGYVYDMPQPTVLQQEQYDVPPSQPIPAQPLTEESYDVPKPVVGTGSLTPSSSISSLTTDSNRSSLIQQDYDVPRPSRTVVPQIVYDVPRGVEMGFDMTSALEWLGRLESDITGSISRILALTTVGWRTRAKLEPRLIEIKSYVSKLNSSLHDLTIFSRSVLAKHQESGLGTKLGPLVIALSKAELQIQESTKQLESVGWNVNALAVEEQETRNPDMLDNLVQCVASLIDDIRAIASFIQGNSTLLFKRNTPTCQPTSPEDVQYMNTMPHQDDPLPLKESDEVETKEENHILSTEDKKVVELYTGFYWTQANRLAQAIDEFLTTVTQNQPPKVFLAQCKAVVMEASHLLLLGESIERSLESSELKDEANTCNRFMSEFLSGLVNKTKSAAVQFPSVKAVQKMVDAVVELSRLPDRFKHSLASAARLAST
ncbi:breast cancer anti-estrogen resistance protein 1 [Cimex lectularius]|uniref:SH3 domain-containing protein n=1 Tax=Cimex lectularius TaxID=79782 RepID=A0A8I6RC74_CIMLE|nr:breast cancer anti-estrogen resistance protein 1 [Cimex lectularius]XP_014243175.1 breast cancer anti-estrogen resistance protein 1 [Cimex lectularius]